MITKERKREIKKMYLATQRKELIKRELAVFYVCLEEWIQSASADSKMDIQLLESINYVIEQHDIAIDTVGQFIPNFTVEKLKDRLVQQHFELTKILSMMSDCGLDNLPSWNLDTRIIDPVANLHTDIGYVLDENNLARIPL